ncbi:uncharacterized protein METZ01_LOCUS256125, partial [marine metagenome]
DGTYSNCTITVTDNASNTKTLSINSFTIDTVKPVLAQVTAVSAFSNDNTSSYTFSSTEAGSISYGGSCSSSSDNATTDNNTITFNALADGTYSNCTIQVTDNTSIQSDNLTVSSFTIDTVKPVLAQVTAVANNASDSTPSYTFSSTESGTILSSGSCSSSTSNASTGNNTISFNLLADGTYSNCGIQVRDSASNTSDNLTVSSFTISGSKPALAQVTPVSTLTNDKSPNYTFSSTKSGTITYGGSCSSSTTSATDNLSGNNNTITFNALADGTYSNCTIRVTDNTSHTSDNLTVSSFTIDTVKPVLAQVTAIGTTNDSTPNYSFSSTESGTILSSGSCSSSTSNASTGNNTISF